jgi:two-component system LytT family response regulator
VIRILILEDQEISRNALKEMILSACDSGQIVVDMAASFSMAKKLIESDIVYSAFFLDINLDETNEDDKSGIEIAKLIRSNMRYGLTPIIMVTSIASMEMEAYRSLHCYQYLIKPYMKVDVENIVSKLIALEHVKEEKTIIVKKDGINYRIKCNAIVYVKAIPRGICLYLKKEVMKVPYLTIVKLMEQLDTSEFIQCHRMFVVNKKYIENVDFVNRMIRMEYYNEDIEIGGTYKNHLKEILD